MLETIKKIIKYRTLEKLKLVKRNRYQTEELYLMDILPTLVKVSNSKIDIYQRGDVWFIFNKDDKSLVYEFNKFWLKMINYYKLKRGDNIIESEKYCAYQFDRNTLNELIHKHFTKILNIKISYVWGK